MRMKKILYLCASLLCTLITAFGAFSCTSFQADTQSTQNAQSMHTEDSGCAESGTKNASALLEPEIKQQPLYLAFAGDIMAHTVNYRMKDYNLIYEDIVPLLSSRDLAFANLETPVCDKRPYQTYPCFNVHAEYVEAAVKAGFNVFSLANNHTNDQGKEGIEGTAACFKGLQKQNVYSAGLKHGNSNGISYALIDVQGWKILFAAVTEIANSNIQTALFDFYPDSPKGKAALKKSLAELRRAYPCDAFILSVHVSDPEYVLGVTKARRTYFYELLNAGVDIIWANHSHVTKPWERIVDAEGKTVKFIMYGAGNTISGQNIPINFADPAHPYEYTGTGVIFGMELKQVQTDVHAAAIGSAAAGTLSIENIQTEIIVTHADEKSNYVIKRLTEDFIGRQNKKLAAYYAKRLSLMRQIGEITWP